MATTGSQNSDPTTGNPPRRRLWIPVSLRLLLIVLALLGIVGGASVCRRVAAIRDIRHFNGTIQYLHPCSPERLWAWIGEKRLEWFDDPLQLSWR
jgi:hypothetical protein